MSVKYIREPKPKPKSTSTKYFGEAQSTMQMKWSLSQIPFISKVVNCEWGNHKQPNERSLLVILSMIVDMLMSMHKTYIIYKRTILHAVFWRWYRQFIWKTKWKRFKCTWSLNDTRIFTLNAQKWAKVFCESKSELKIYSKEQKPAMHSEFTCNPACFWLKFGSFFCIESAYSTFL